MTTQVRSRRGWRRLIAVSMLLLLVSALLSVAGTGGAVAAEGDEESSDGGEGGGNPAEGLGGYSTEASGAPLSMLLFEPVTPVPVDPGKPHLRADHAYVLTDLSTGPQGRALASSLWPGALIGDGFPTIAALVLGEEAPSYPLKTDARSPSNEPKICTEAPGGAGMCSVAEGFQVRATAQAGESPAGEQVAFGNLDGVSFGRVVDGKAVSTVTVTAQDVNLLGGLITIDSVETVVTTASDGTAGASGGSTTVNGLTIAGQGYTVDENGLQAAGNEVVGELPAPPGQEDIATALGIEATLLGHEEAITGARASRAAGGLQIRIDMGVLRDQIDTAPIEDVLKQLPAIPNPGVPEDVTSQLPIRVFQEPYLTLLPAFLLSPEVVFIVGNAQSETAATEPLQLDFDLPALPPPTTSTGPTTEPAPPPPPPPAEPSTSTPLSVPDATETSAPAPPTTSDEPATDPVVAPDPQPVAQPQGTTPQSLGFEGIAPFLALLGLAGAAVGSWGLRATSAAVFGTAGACPDGKSDSLPDLKGA